MSTPAAAMYALLTDGSTVEIRPARAQDADAVYTLAWQGDRLVGVATYEPAGNPGVAEIAFAVPDDMHGRGIATLLLEHLVWQARQRNLRTFTAKDDGGELGNAPGIRRCRPAREAADIWQRGQAGL